ncbi:DUF3500 domain-containing protein [Ramlibacter tataouinensis]|uniref:DUF3500 domain-containing protein n=1 Tax=Ramlibacter tataouinensis (strain ATCC BAA-407 / DSM 14655 / LMG 21543 / TTB310) TaxID=365046 RepID=F5Y629_RAMTT|nr:DUF3500 domain-containing protein [Ramlibacter tataouinensis]AEG91533.1 Conserved hypothetical protein [Ramlibacter tataouinensis TTB310]
MNRFSGPARSPLCAIAVMSVALTVPLHATAQQSEPALSRADINLRRSLEAEARGLGEPFRGVTTDGRVVPNLFENRSTGVSTEPVRQAAVEFLSALTEAQRAKTRFPVDDIEWRKWMNPHFYVRQGVAFGEMSAGQRDVALGLLRASLSAKGLRQSQDIMRLNHTLAELTGKFDEYGEGYYYLTLMGEPSADQPWGWQLDGHHLVINYFVLGDQVVMTPTFMGSEPAVAKAGKYAGTAVLQVEQAKGLELINDLSASQRRKAVLSAAKAGANTLAEAFKDNLVLDHAGIPARELSARQRARLVDLISVHVGNLREQHASVKMSEVMRHLDDTYFAWIGETRNDGVFYYRVQSPVILIEFDHQAPIALTHLERGRATREHIHSVVRTPNGNDYGKDLLRQHYERHHHPHTRQERQP